MKCSNCGMENEENNQFCKNCGATLTPKTNITDTPIKIENNLKNHKLTRKNKTILITSIIIILIIAGGFLLVNMINKSTETYTGDGFTIGYPHGGSYQTTNGMVSFYDKENNPLGFAFSIPNLDYLNSQVDVEYAGFTVYNSESYTLNGMNSVRYTCTFNGVDTTVYAIEGNNSNTVFVGTIDNEKNSHVLTDTIKIT